ncbi:hypothetical protein EOD23_11865 [Mesorhizobium sp. USDA-HM6]|nr:hypothetical protein EOD23_11865 [Mesorhizobium sp. USDA-HM6]
MKILIPLLSLIGPVYFGVRGYSIVAVVMWAVIWTALRFLATWKYVYSTLKHRDRDGSATWANRHPSFAMLAAFFATLIGLVAVHAAIYWIVWRSIQSLN